MRWTDLLAEARGLSAAASRAAAQDWLSTDSPRLWIIVGDRAQIEEQVDGLGLPVQWIDPSQALLGDFEVAR